MSLIEISERFINHLNSLERMMSYSDIIKEQYTEEKKEDLTLFDIMDMIMDVKSNEYSDEKEPDDIFKEKKLILDSIIDGSELIRYIYNNLIMIEKENGDISLSFTSPLVERMFKEEMNTQHNFQTDMTQLRNSIIISMVTSLELLISDLFKDFIQHIDQSDIINKRSINYNELLKIGDINEARNFLLDQFVEELLRSSFLNWVKEIKNKMKINLMEIDVIRDEDSINLINETFQRRHLLIHNGGKVNDLYLSKIDSDLSKGLSKNDVLDNSNTYIINRIRTFKKAGIVLIYLYGEKKYKDNKNELVGNLSEVLLSLGSEGCCGARYVYQRIHEDINISHSNRLISIVNYYLSHKLNNSLEEEVKEELENFDVETLSIEYKMAKNILLDNIQDAISDFKTFANSVSNNEFFHIIDWPLLKFIKDNTEVKEFISERTKEIISKEGSEDIEELAHN